MSTPVGDWIRRRWPDNPGATHYLGEGDDPGCCAGPHARCTYSAGWAEGLVFLAAEFDRLAAETTAEVAAHEASNDDDAACMADGARGAWQGAAARARAHARSVHSGGNGAAPVSPEGQDGTEPLSAPQRVALGMLVRAVWVAWAREQPGAKPSWLAGWADLDDGQREVDMRIGEAVAAAERERIIVLLRRAASGRREYAGPHGDSSEAREVLLKSAEHYESAACLIEDPRNMLDVMPSWMWTDEENASLRGKQP